MYLVYYSSTVLSTMSKLSTVCTIHAMQCDYYASDVLYCMQCSSKVHDIFTASMNLHCLLHVDVPKTIKNFNLNKI